MRAARFTVLLLASAPAMAQRMIVNVEERRRNGE